MKQHLLKVKTNTIKKLRSGKQSYDSFMSRFSFGVRLILLIVIIVASVAFLLPTIVKAPFIELAYLPYNEKLARLVQVYDLQKKPIVPTKLAATQGISDVTIYIYATGTNWNDEYIAKSLANAQQIGSTKNVKVLALYDRPNQVAEGDLATKMYLVTNGKTEKINSKEIDSIGRANMTDPQTMYDFIHFGMSNYPARKTVVIVDGIGKGPAGVIYDESVNNYFTAASLQGALANIMFSGGTLIDTLVIGSSHTASAEFLSSLTEYVHFTIAATDALPLSAIDYNKLLETVNENSKSDRGKLAQAIFQTVSIDKTCTKGRYYLYGNDQLLNITNALETITAGYFQDQSGVYRAETLQAIANLTPVFATENDLPLYSFYDFAHNLAASEHVEVRTAGAQLVKDIAGTIKAKCQEIEADMLFSFPIHADEQINVHLRNVEYARIQSFRELLRQLYRNDRIENESIKVVATEENTVQLETANNLRGCYQGVYTSAGYLVSKYNIGYTDSEGFKCSMMSADYMFQNLPVTLNSQGYELPSLINSQYGMLLANSYFSTEGTAKFILTTGDGSNDFTFKLDVPEAGYDYKYLGKLIGNSNQLGVYYSDNTNSTNTQIDPTTLKYTLAVTQDDESNNPEKLFIIDNETQTIGLKSTYRLFELIDDLPNTTLANEIKLHSSKKKYNYYSQNFGNRTMLEPLRNIAIDFKYFEFIYATQLAMDATTEKIFIGAVALGADEKYYQGDVLASRDNIKFWDKWYQGLESTKQITDEVNENE